MSKLGFSFVGITKGRISVMLPDMTIKDEPILFLTEVEAATAIAETGNNKIMFQDTCVNPGLYHRPFFNKDNFKQLVVKTRNKGISNGKAKEGQVPQSPNG